MKRFLGALMLSVMLLGIAQPAAAYPWVPSGFPPVDYRPPNYNTPSDGYDDGDYFENDYEAFMCLMMIEWTDQLAFFSSLPFGGFLAEAYYSALDMLFEFDPDCYFYYYYGSDYYCDT